MDILVEDLGPAVVVTPAVENSLDIEVTPISKTSSISGKLSSWVRVLKGGSTDMKMDAKLSAFWNPINQDNRVTCPSVHKGEIVNLYRYVGTDLYYWTTTVHNYKIRRLDHVEYDYSAIPMDSTEEPTDKNRWKLMISPLHKLAMFTTTRANREVTAYKVGIDANTGILHVETDRGTGFRLDSVGNRLTIDADVTINGNLQHNGSSVVTGSVAIGGSSKIGGSFKVKGSTKMASVNTGGLVSTSFNYP